MMVMRLVQLVPLICISQPNLRNRGNMVWLSMTDEKRDQRIPIMMTVADVKAIDDWSFANRIRSRGEAIRQLIQKGLGAK